MGFERQVVERAIASDREPHRKQVHEMTDHWRLDGKQVVETDGNSEHLVDPGVECG